MVKFSLEMIRRSWHAVDDGDLWLEFTPDDAPTDELWLDVADAMTAADDAATTEQDVPDEVTSVGPYELAPGPAACLLAVVGAQGDDVVDAWVIRFAAALTDAGRSGRVAPMPRRRSETWDRAEKIPWPQLTMYSSYTLADYSRERVRHRTWNVDEATTTRITQEIERCAFPEAKTFTLVSVRRLWASPHDIAKALSWRLPRQGHGVAAHVSSDASRVVHIGHGVNGLVSRRIYDPSRSWQDRLAECVSAMTALPDITRLAFIQWGRGFNSGWDDLDQGSPPTAVPGYKFRYNPQVLDRFIPDARGLLLVQDAHLERANDLSSWTIDSLGHGRHVLAHPEPDAWYSEPELDAGVLSSARRDLGEMIITPADVQVHEQRPHGTE